MRRGLGLSLALGLGAALLFLSPFSDRPLTPHMADHLLLGDLAPLLAAFALPRGRVRAAPALALWVATRAVWHVPAVFDAAVRHPALHALEHLSLYAGGLALAAVVVDAGMRPAARLAGVGVFQVGGMILGLILIWAPTALYAHEGGVHQQRIAGALMMGEGTLVSAALFAWILLGVLREERVGTLASR